MAAKTSSSSFFESVPNPIDFFESSLLSIQGIITSTLAGPSCQSALLSLHSILSQCHVPAELHPRAETIAVWFTATVVTMGNYFILFGNRHVRRRMQLKKDLILTAERMQELEEKLLEINAEELVKVDGREVRQTLDSHSHSHSHFSNYKLN